jgi:hypothetical protein
MSVCVCVCVCECVCVRRGQAPEAESALVNRIPIFTRFPGVAVYY